MTTLLETRTLCKTFGALTVADNIDFKLEAGARHALIGPNGAGKTTFVNLLTGRLAPSNGTVWIAGENVTQLSQRDRVRRGLGRTFQINNLFRGLTVVDNVSLAIAERLGLGWNMFRPAISQRAVLEEAHALLATLGLTDDATATIANLPYGKQRLVEIAIALGMKPRVLLLDEPAAGVPSLETHRILEVLAALPKDIAILIIEHDMDVVFRFAKRITVLVQGATLVEGTPDQIANDSQVRAVYLGESHV